MDALSRQFIGLPYRTNPLIGSAGEREVFTASTGEFDCVTYVETVLALALSSNVDEFADWRRKIRYEGKFPVEMSPASRIRSGFSRRMIVAMRAIPPKPFRGRSWP